ncbi:MAG: GNAT family N-acyltransferase [Thermoanaerobaculia bacterium]|nr:GNAT family N-acyltransferase [Thermoanaerobaculia bacterium]
MNEAPRLTFKIASEASEFEAIHRLNHQTFVEEIPQHGRDPSGRRVDPFHAENTHVIALHAGDLVGMMALRGRRPFSLDAKLPDLDDHLPVGRRPCEIRLLAVVPAHRRGPVFRGLLELLVSQGKAQGYDLAVISGTTRQAKLYRHLGFVPFGPLLGTGEARFQPMYLTLEVFEEQVGWLSPKVATANFLPGPVAVRPEVAAALAQPAVSHRSAGFESALLGIRSQLRELTGARHVQILLGSGTLANDAVAGQLSLLGEPGLILVNGEFGRRLVDHGRRWRLNFEVVESPWGAPLDLDSVGRRLRQSPLPGWLWAVHHETSTGVLNDLPRLADLCADAGPRLCLDAISSLGTVPVDLARVFLASGVGGKGLGSYPGLALVFHHHDIPSRPERLPRYLDLGLYASGNGVPFTHSSNLLAALAAALERPSWPERFEEIQELGAWLRAELRRAGFEVLAPEDVAAPAVVTVVLPPAIDSRRLGAALERSGFLLSWASEYLHTRNWVQICLMGEVTRSDLALAVDTMARLTPRPARLGP